MAKTSMKRLDTMKSKMQSRLSQVDYLQNIIKTGNITRFYIRDQEESEIPVNQTNKIGIFKDPHKKITNLLQSK